MNMPRAPRDRPLEDFSTGALVRELERRADGITMLRSVKRWCDDCQHFRHSTSERDTRNNCTREHVMDFRMPDEATYTDMGGWGFYRRGCSDWCVRREPDGPPISLAGPQPNPFPPPPPPRGSRPRRAK